MSGPKPSPPASRPPARARVAGFELKLEQGRAFVRLADQVFLTGVRLADLQLEVPGVRFPFDVGAGASQFRLHLCDLARLELAADEAGAAAFAARLFLAGTGLGGLAVALRAGFAEVAGRLEGGSPFTVKVGAEPEGEQALRLVAYAPRLYRAGPIPEAALPFALARAAAALGRAEGAALVCEPLGATLRRLLPSRGWKLPRVAGARLGLLAFEPGRVRIAWDRDQSPATPAADPELLEAVEGARAFAAAEAFLAGGDAAAARDELLRQGPVAADHPFAAARLLSLLSADERFHDEAIDLAQSWLSRRPDFPSAVLALARVREARGEAGPASELLSRLAAAAARRGEELSAIAAADACLAHGPRATPAAASAAVEVALGLRRDHLPALRALLALGERGGDREALLRACRRLAAYSGDDAEKAAAHATLGRLLLHADPAAARLHLDHALRLSPAHPDTAESLARACEEAGEHLRAVKAWDRTRELRLAAGDRAGAARAAAAVGRLWEEKLLQPENALLRYREAADLDPGPEAQERTALVAGALGHWAEAADRWSAVLAGSAAGAPGAAPRIARARRELARIAEERLSDPGRAAQHLEAALELEPDDAASLERLASLYGKLSRPAERLAMLDRLAAHTAAPAARALVLAEAARLAPSLAEARRRWEAVAALAPGDAEALRALADAALALGDAPAERDALTRLAALPVPPGEAAAALDRLAASSRRAGHLAAALETATRARRALPTQGRLALELALATELGDPRLADVHGEQAEATAATDPAAAARSWLARARLLAAGDPASALAALAEALHLAPGDPEALDEQARVAMAHGDPSLALQALEELAALRPEDGDLAARLARAALAAGDRELARDHAERAVALGSPQGRAVRSEVLALSADPAAAASRVVSALSRPDPAERLALLREALDLDPSSIAALRGLAYPDVAALLGPERPDLLARLAAHPRASADEAAEALGERARALLAAGDGPGAVAAAREAVRRSPGEAGPLDVLAEVAADRDPAARAEALLGRAALAREAGEAETPARLAAAGQAALAAGQDQPGRAALRQAIAAGLEREEAVSAWQALASAARRLKDEAGEREALEALSPLLPTGEKPAALLRLAALRASAGDEAAAREAAEAARRLAPRDPAAVEACLSAAERARDLPAVADRLAELAELDPARAGPRLLERARLLLGPLGRHPEGDDDFTRAAELLPPDAALASEQARLRRAAPPPTGQRPWGEPLEVFARRAPDPDAARALREAAGMALAQGDGGAALRCARRAYERSASDPAFAGPLLAGLLHREGAAAEALALHRRLFEEALPRLEERGRIRICRGLAELAEEAGDAELSRRALERILEERPGDPEAALELFRLDPERRRAVNDLAERAGGWRSASLRARAWARAAATARGELRDPALADALWRRARGAAGDYPSLLAAVEELRLGAARTDADVAGLQPPLELLDALRDAAAAREAAGDASGASALRAEAAELAGRHGLAGDELRERRSLAERQPGDPRSQLLLGLAAERAGSFGEAAGALGPALEADPGQEGAGEAFGALARSLLATGDARGAAAAARRQIERTRPAGAGERRAALEVGLLVLEKQGEEPDVDLLELLAALLLAEGDPRGEALADRTVGTLSRIGEGARASALLALASRAATGARRAGWLRRLAGAARSRGDAAAARAAVAEALLADPGDQALRQAHLAELEALGDPEALARALAEALRVGGGDRAPLLAKLARASARIGDEAGAERAEAELYELGPSAPGWAEAAAAMERRFAGRGDARALAELGLRRAEAAPSAAERAAGLAAAAGALLDVGAGAEARAAARGACEADPDAPEPWRALARLEERDGKPAEAARAHLAAALRSEPAAAAREASEAARLFESAGLADDAARAWGAAAAALPGSPPARRALAARATAAGDLPEVARQLAALDRELLPRSERREHDLRLARAYAAAGMPEADQAYQALFDDDAGDPEVFEIVGGAARRRGDRDGWLRLAARHDGALAAGDPVRRRDLRCARAALLEEMGQHDAAEGAWQAALAIDPEHRPALAGIRRLTERRGDRATAADLAAREASLARFPDEAARLLLEEARLRRDLKDMPRAAAALERAAELAESAGPEGQVLADEARRVLAEVRPPLVPTDDEVTQPVPPLEGEPPGAAGLPWDGEAAPAGGTLSDFLSEPEALSGLPGQRATLSDFPGEVAPPALPPGEATLPTVGEAAADRPGGGGTLSDFLGGEPAPGAGEPGPGTLPEFPPLTELPPLELPPPTPVEEAAAEGEERHSTLSYSAAPPAPPAAGPAPAERLDPSWEADPDPAADGRLRDFAAGAQGPDRAAALRALSRRLERRGEDGAAADVLAEAAEADPASAEALIPALLAMAAGDPARSIAAHRLRIRIASSPAARVAAMIDLGRQLVAQPNGRAEGADVLEKALGLQPGNGLAAEALARAFIALGSPERALTLLAGFERGAPGLPPRAVLALELEAARAGGDPALAMEKARRAARSAPMDAELQEWWAVAAGEAGAYGEAVEAWNAARAAQARASPEDELRRRQGLRAALEAAGRGEEARAEGIAADLIAANLRAERDRAERPPPSADRPAAEPAPPPAAPPRAGAEALDLASALERARQVPAGAAALLALAQACHAPGSSGRDAARRAELARLAAALAAFADPALPVPPAPPLPARVAPEVRDRAALPLARGPVASLLALLSPWLEPLFPADLARRRVGPGQRLGPQRAPALSARLGAAGRALAARPVAAFLSDEGFEAALENTQPPSLVVGAQLARELRESAVDFALARALCLADLGWSLVGKFAARDVGVLCELACRFAGGAPPALGLPAERAGAFLDALGRNVPATVRVRAGQLAADAAAELRTLPPRELQLALRRTAARQALLWAGDPLGALEALAAARRRPGEPDPLADRARALADPDLADLCAYTLSDLFLELRLAVGLGA